MKVVNFFEDINVSMYFEEDLAAIWRLKLGGDLTKSEGRKSSHLQKILRE